MTREYPEYDTKEFFQVHCDELREELDKAHEIAVDCIRERDEARAKVRRVVC